MRGVQVFVRAVLGIAIVAAGVSGAVLPAHAGGVVAPGVPRWVVVSNPDFTSFDVAWTAPASDGGAEIMAYDIEYRKVGELSWTSFAPAIPMLTSSAVNGLDSNSTYQFRIAAVNSAGQGPWSVQDSAIAVGDYHACAVLADGTVTCWGDNNFGQLGDDTIISSLVPVQVSVLSIDGLTPATTAVSVSTGGDHSCAVMADGSATCWGYNGYGQLGDTSNTSREIPVAVTGITGFTPASTALSVTAGEFFSCAVMADGTAKCWGYNAYGQLGDNTAGDSNIPVQVSVLSIDGLTTATSAISVSAGKNQACAVMVDGAVKCWGSNSNGQLGNNLTADSPVPVQVSGIDGADAGSAAVSVSAGDYQSCAVLADGTATCWGDNSYGQLGNATEISSPVPVPVSAISGLTPEATAVSVSTGMFHSCAVMATGTAACWGRESHGQLGSNTGVNSSVPVPVSGIDGLTPATTADNVIVRVNQSCAVMADVTAACWGNNTHGQLGNNSNTNSPVPESVWVLDGSTPATSLRRVSSFGRTLQPSRPSVPLHVVTSNATPTSLDVAWTVPTSDGGVYIESYTIEYRKVGEQSWATFTPVVPPETSATVDGLDSNSTYQFRIAAVNSAGPGPWSVQESAIAAGFAHSCAVMANSTVKCWGINIYGQLGDNTTDESSAPVLVWVIDGSTPATSAVSVSAGGNHSCALMADGTVTCWGYNYYGQLGNNSGADSPTPVLVSVLSIDGLTPATTAVSVSLGAGHSCALMADGTAKCWGNNGYGQLGGATGQWNSVPVQVSMLTIDGLTPATTAVSVSAGFYHSCAVMVDGTAKCWGNNATGQLGDNTTNERSVPVLVSVLSIDGLTAATSAVSVSAGSDHTCALMADGTAKCWGYNYFGQLGNNSGTDSHAPVSVLEITGLTPATTAVSVSTGENHSCALMADGTAKCWGFNSYGQLGDNTVDQRPVPVSVLGMTGLTPGSTAFSVVTGGSHSCAAMTDSTARCWGNNAYGQLGSNATPSSPVPEPVSVIDGSTLAKSLRHVSAFGRTLEPSLPSEPLLVATSNATSSSLDVSWTAPANDGGAAISAYTLEYRQVNEPLWSTFTPADPTVTTVTVDGLDSDSSYQFRVAAINSAGTGPWSGKVRSIATSESDSCSVTVDGTVICWGSNDDGQLGNDSTTESFVPVQVSGITGLTPATRAVSVGTKARHSCSLMADGSITCWGKNNNGQLGNGSFEDSLVPVPVSDITGLAPATTATSVGAGGQHSCALMANGTVTCWGDNYLGQLGNNFMVWFSFVPVPVSGISGLTPEATAVTLSVGVHYSCVVMADGTAACWGKNDYGQLGDNSTTEKLVPVPVRGINGSTPGTTAVSVSAGGTHTCAVMADGTAKCWGDNRYGQLGDDSTTDSLVPMQVSVLSIDGLTPGTTAVSVSAGDGHSCAVMADGSAICWGDNRYGQLGNESNTDSHVPVQVFGITGLTPGSTTISVSAGGYHSCALLADGNTTCWGYNSRGELGDNSTTNSNVPVRVLDTAGAGSSFGRTLAEPLPPEPSQLSRPVRLMVTDRNADSIAISWGVPTSNGGKHIDRYRVSYRPKGSASWTAFAIVPYSQLHLRVRGLRTGVTYEFQVRAHNADGLGNPSRIVSETVPMRAAAPIVVQKFRDQSAIALTWRAVKAPAHSPLTAYVMSCRDSNGDTLRTSVTTVNLSASIRVLAAQPYSCRVAAITEAGRGVGSERVQISSRIRD